MQKKHLPVLLIIYRRTGTEREIEKFIQLTNAVIKSISVHPEMFRKSAKINIREALITKHNPLIYSVAKNQIDLITFFDTRQIPKKKKLLK